MHVDLPLPTNLVLLALLLPGIGVAGYEISVRLTSQRLLRHALTPILALACWLSSVHALAFVARSFVVGLRAGTVTVALAGVAAHFLRRRKPAAPGGGATFGPSALILVALSTIPIAWMAFRWAFHDEDLYNGHMAIPAQIQNDVYPPRHLTFPDLRLRYHYGVNLFVACITALTRVRVDVGIDIATVLLWIITGSLLWALGQIWFNRGWVMLPVTLFAGGPPICLFDPARSPPSPPGVCRVVGPGVLAPFVSTFFQHPWSLGLPLGLAVLLVFSAREHTQPRARLVVLGILLTLLSLGHAVLFMTLLPSVVAAEAWFAWKHEGRPLGGAGVLITATAAVALAFAFGGLVGSIGAAGTRALVLQLGAGKGLADTLRWHVQSFGLALPIAVIGLPLLPPRGRVVTALLLAGSLLIVNGVRYIHSGDIIKFGVVASLAMAFAGAALVHRILLARDGHRPAARAMLGGLAALIVAASSWGGLAHALYFFSKAAERHYAHAVPSMAADDARAASFLRARIKAGEMIFRREGPAAGYTRWAGLPVPWPDWATETYGVPMDRIKARLRLLRVAPAEPAAYLAEGIGWFVLEPADVALNARADAWIAAGQATLVGTFGRLRVVRLAQAPR